MKTMIRLAAMGVLALVALGLVGEGRASGPVGVYLIPPFIGCSGATDSADTTAFDVLTHQIDTITYKVNTNSVPRGVTSAEFEAAIDGSFDTWDAIIPGAERFIDGGTTNIKKAFPDGESVVTYGGLSFGAAGAAGFTIIWSVDGDGDATEVDTVFAKGIRWSANASFAGDPDTAGSPAGCGGDAGEFDIAAVAVHEIGHWLGLDHPDPDNDQQTMSTPISAGELRKRTPDTGDKCGLEALGYGDTGVVC